MLKGRPTRAATARQAQQASTQRFDFKVEEEAEEAVIIASPGLLRKSSQVIC